LLERILRQEKRHDDLLDVYDRRIATAVTPDDKATAEVLAGTLAEELGRPEQAFEHYRRALVASPAEPRALHSIARSLGAAGKWTELAKAYDSALRATKKGEGEVPLLLAIAQIHWKRLAQIDSAELLYRRVRKMQPVHPEVIDFYRDYHTPAGEIPQLLALLAQAQKVEPDPDLRVVLGIEMASWREAASVAGEGHRRLEGAAQAAPRFARGGGGAAAPVHPDREVERAARAAQDDLEALPKDAVDDRWPVTSR